MDRNKFLSKLAAELSGLPKEEIEAAMEFYTEYLDDVGIENEKEAIESLGSPENVAAHIKADYAVRQTGQEGETFGERLKRGFDTIGSVIKGSFAAPTSAPKAIFIGIISILLIVLLIAFLAVVIVGVVSVIIGAIYGIIVSAINFAYLPSSASMSIGINLILVGVGMLLLGVIYKLCSVLVSKLLNAIQKTNEKRRAEKMAKDKEVFIGVVETVVEEEGANYEEQ